MIYAINELCLLRKLGLSLGDSTKCMKSLLVLHKHHMNNDSWCVHQTNGVIEHQALSPEAQVPGPWAECYATHSIF